MCSGLLSSFDGTVITMNCFATLIASFIALLTLSICSNTSNIVTISNELYDEIRKKIEN